MWKGSAVFTQDRENCLAFYHSHTHTHTHTHTEPKRCWCDNRVVCKIWYAVANQFERFSLEHKCSTAYCNTLHLATTALEACTVRLGYHSGGMKRSLFILSFSMIFQVHSTINNIKYRCLHHSFARDMLEAGRIRQLVTCTEKISFFQSSFAWTFFLCLLFWMSSPCLLDPSLTPRRCWYVSSVKVV